MYLDPSAGSANASRFRENRGGFSGDSLIVAGASAVNNALGLPNLGPSHEGKWHRNKNLRVMHGASCA